MCHDEVCENIQFFFWVSVHLNEGKAGHGGNTALVVGVAAHEDVSLVTPRCTPRVLDDVVVCRVL